MTQKIVVVIGSAFGDEGKGLMTDYHASQLPNVAVIRFNGGAQAGHTVTTPDGRRHVFSHLGSGSFVGAPTYFSEFFVANPAILRKELHSLDKDTINSLKLYAHPEMLITTPFDVLINQYHEISRGSSAHGSVGVGFGETIERQYRHSALRMVDVVQCKQQDIYSLLRKIRDEYVPTRIDLSKATKEFKEILFNEQLIEDTIDDLNFLARRVSINDYHDGVMSAYDNLIFEGAQGLLLDQHYGYFPHVTRSNCGMKNVRKILNQYFPFVDDVTVNYVTRAYTTRHGAGPLQFENPNMFYIEDKTNITNEWQGSLRFAPFDVNTFEMVTSKDFALYGGKNSKRVNTITCLDQLPDLVPIVKNNVIHYLEKSDFFKEVVARFEFRSYGPTRDTIKEKHHDHASKE